jgi:hypothetical protein
VNTYIIYWSRGPMDNPDDGQIEISAMMCSASGGSSTARPGS